MRLSTFVGSLVDQALGAHAIVNASNPHVGLGSGVSGAIRAACGGAAFQTERDPAMYQSGCDMTRTYSIVDAVARTRVAFVRMVP